MLNRWIGISCGLGMLLANGAVVWRDMLPNWLAGDPPRSEAQILSAGEERFVQVGIYADGGQALGTSWTHARSTGIGGLVMVNTTTLLQPITLGGIATPRVLIQTDVNYRHDAALIDELKFSMRGLGLAISLHGESLPTGDFPMSWQIGTQHGELVLDSRVPAALGDVIRPFDRLPGLYVGRTWKLKLLDPLAQMFPALHTEGMGLEPALIEVTDHRTVRYRGEDVEAFIVEGGGATAWVADDGRVLQQVVVLPLLGRLVLLDEPFDADALQEAARLVRFEGHDLDSQPTEAEP